MIKKTIFQGLAIVAVFFAAWLAFSQIDFIKAFNIQQTSLRTHKKLGDFFWQSIERTEEIITRDSATKPVEKLVQRLTTANDIDYSKLKIHIVRNEVVNAFAMPDNHLVIYTGLIDKCDNEGELAGVIGHEMAHLQKNHVMKKLVKEIGLSVLISMAGGNGSGTRALRILSSSAYDRNLESEADLTSAEYMLKAGMNPEQFADMMYKMSVDTGPDHLSWLNTHPDSEDRAKAILATMKGRKFKLKPVLTGEEWEGLKKTIKD